MARDLSHEQHQTVRLWVRGREGGGDGLRMGRGRVWRGFEMGKVSGGGDGKVRLDRGTSCDMPYLVLYGRNVAHCYRG